MSSLCYLKEGVYLVEGAKRAALCDTNSGNVYSLNAIAKDIIVGLREDAEFWRSLVEMGLAEQTEEAILPQLSPELSQEKISLEFIWFEITNDCNARCIHCYADSMPPPYRKATNFVPVSVISAAPQQVSIGRPKISFRQWIELIKEGAELGCQQCQFIGGEPLLYRGQSGETVLDLSQAARSVGYEFVEIFTNATLITTNKIQRIKELGLHIAVSLYSSKPQIHDAVTRTPGSFQKTMRALKMLRQAQIPTRVETILMRTNQKTVEETMKLVEGMGFQHKSPDVLRPKGRGDDPQLMPDLHLLVRYGLMTKPNFRADRSFFARSRSRHNCLGGKITITDQGDVLPCIFSRNQIVGNVLESSSLQTIVSSRQLQAIWHTTKDDILVCRDCEYRYVCFDCRPLSEACANRRVDYLHAPYPNCTYNPYTGEWAQGVWRVDEEGQPLYDRSLGSVIQEVIQSGQELGVTPRGH